MAIELSEGDIGKKIRIRRGNEVMDWYLADIDQYEINPEDLPHLHPHDLVRYRFKKQINDPEEKWINLRKRWFTWGHATLERLEGDPMNLDGGRRRRNRKTKRRHMKKRKSRCSCAPRFLRHYLHARSNRRLE